MSNPYREQPSKAFWKKTVSPYHPLDIDDWYTKRFCLEGMTIATAGSCFAQHIGRNLRKRGFGYLDVEPAPQALPKNLRSKYGYEIYSARYGNIYTARQLLQLLKRALGLFKPEESHWEKQGGVVDPFRPTLEPEPFGSVAELLELQNDHLSHVAEMFRTTDVFVFTLGLTEAWIDKSDGAVFPLCPGTSGGVFDPSRYAFVNLKYADIFSDLREFFELARSINPKLRVILTVSPVPLMATATNQQVVVATTYSKSVLRAVAGDLYEENDFVDYFPSFEIITSSPMGGLFFEPDKREVSSHGVAHVMSVFFSEHAVSAGTGAPPIPSDIGEKRALSPEEEAERIKCDEELLAAFGTETNQ